MDTTRQRSGRDKRWRKQRAEKDWRTAAEGNKAVKRPRGGPAGLGRLGEFQGAAKS